MEDLGERGPELVIWEEPKLRLSLLFRMYEAISIRLVAEPMELIES